MKEKQVFYVLLVTFVILVGAVVAFQVQDFFKSKVVNPIQNAVQQAK